MEFKEYCQIIKKDLKLFIATVIIIVVGVFLYFNLQPVSYNSSILINITRAGSQETTDYKYDDYYRLQADERFVDTVVEWVRSPRLAADIPAGAKKITAEKRSSQIAAISFSSVDEESAMKISASLVDAISKNTQKLNESQKENTWFKIMAEKPVVEKYQPNYKIIILAALCLGIFLAFWIVMIRYYLK